MIRGSSVASLFSGCFLEMVPVMVMGICDNRVFVTYQALGIPLFFKEDICLFYFLAALGLHCYTWAFSSCSEQGLLSSCGMRASHCGGFSCYGAQALGTSTSVTVARPYLLCSMWDLPRPGIEPVPLALAGGLLATGPPGTYIF